MVKYNRIKVGASAFALMSTLGLGSVIAVPAFAAAPAYYSTPLAMTATYDSANSTIDASWTPPTSDQIPAGGSTHYTLYVSSQASNGGAYGPAVTSSNVAYDGTSTSFAIGGFDESGTTETPLVAGTAYTIILSPETRDASNNFVSGFASTDQTNVVFGAATGSTYYVPTVPQNLTVVPDATKTGFNVSWSAPSNVGSSPVSSYYISAGATGTTPFYTSDSGTTTATSEDVTPASFAANDHMTFSPGTTYEFTVLAENAGGDSVSTPVVSSTISIPTATTVSTKTTLKAPDTGVAELMLANPLTVAGLGIVAAGSVLYFAKRQLSRR